MKKAPIVTLYANKGGVSKTTNTQHLAWTLVRDLKKTVLCVDADPQCNLTQTLVPESRQNPNWAEPLGVSTVFDALRPVFYGESKELPKAACIEVRPGHFPTGSHLFLLPGSLKLATLEPSVALAHALAVSPAYPLFDSLAGAFATLCARLATTYDADLVLLDLGPSIGELNRNFFYAADFFVLPVAADLYCKATVATLEDTLLRWALAFPPVEAATRRHKLSMKRTLPSFLGFVVSMFNVAGKEKKPVKHQQGWIELIKNLVANKLVPTLKELDMVHGTQVEEFCVAQIPHFLSLLPLSQRSGFPVFDIPEDKFEVLDESTGTFKKMTGSEIKAQKERARFYKEIYVQFAEQLLTLLGIHF